MPKKKSKSYRRGSSTFLPTKVLNAIQDSALSLAKEINYLSLGTVEFLVDEKQNFYFIEMNTRLQVEHPVTEEISGIDLVQEQIKIAAGKNLSLKQEDLIIKGHSLECRINAEDPDSFTPCPGKIVGYHQPGGFGVRVDSYAYQGYYLPPFYDSLIAKLVVHAPSREQAVQKMLQALDEFLVEGIKTSIPLQQRILASLRFQKGELSTNLISHFQK